MVPGRVEKRINRYNLRTAPIHACKDAGSGLEDVIYTASDVIYAALAALGVAYVDHMKVAIKLGVNHCFKHRQNNQKLGCFCCSVVLETTNGNMANHQVINYHLFSVSAVYPDLYCDWDDTKDAAWSYYLIYPKSLTRYPKEADDLFRFGETIAPIVVNFKM